MCGLKLINLFLDKALVFARTKYADVISAVLLTERWPGIIDPDSDLRKATIFRAGRWFVTNDAIICLGQDYYIGIGRLDEMDWFAHSLGKVWLYDPTDMIDSFEAAHAYSLPHASQMQHEEFINAEIQKAIEEHMVPFYPSRILGRHVYLASRMADKERLAFCQFLAEHSFVAQP